MIIGLLESYSLPLVNFLPGSETSSPEENTPTLICLLTLIFFKPKEDNMPMS